MTTPKTLACLLLLSFAACTSVQEYEHCIETRYGKIVNPKMSTGLEPQLFASSTCLPITEQNYPAKDDDEKTPEAERIDNAVTKDSVDLISHVALWMRANEVRDHADDLIRVALEKEARAIVRVTDYERDISDLRYELKQIRAWAKVPDNFRP